LHKLTKIKCNATNKFFDLILEEQEETNTRIRTYCFRNFVSDEVMEAASVLTNKYAEGYPGKDIMEVAK
jgi:glycine/serine hydroxymethyltransferase